MKIDLYTKGILTVIALSLVVMAFKDIDPISQAFAHSGSNTVHKIAICNYAPYDGCALISDSGWLRTTN